MFQMQSWYNVTKGGVLMFKDEFDVASYIDHTFLKAYASESENIGRNLQSKGMSKALTLNVPLSDKGIDAVIENHDKFDLIFE